ncbi:MAG: quinol:electron acceptor oxidoreductase subunit ActD [Thermodesulfovibrionales bacterium]
MDRLSYGDINDTVFRATRPPRPLYFLVLALLGTGALYAAALWLYQTKTGMGATALHDPVDWATYIANFVYWVGLAHSGTLISAIFYLARARWRDAVSRATEAMTVIAIVIAGMFPMIHLGRFWVVYYIVPYPSQRQIWPNFTSPLLWDVLAVSTYLTVSVIFFFVGLFPDTAAFRDACEATLGPRHWKSRLYRILAAGWSGAGGQWRHYGRSYLYFAALATPLVISVHTIVSWDFAMSLLPGWHTTLFAPYFVAGAIHSGLAMGLILLISLRRLLHLDRIIRVEHLEAIAKTILVTTAVMGYSYIVEPFIEWYTGNTFEVQHMTFRATGWTAPIYWSLFFFNVLAPLALISGRVRRSLPQLFLIGVLVNIGMWLERFMIVAGATSHDFMPHNWSTYIPNWVEMGITAGSYCFFFFAYLAFAKLLPTVPIADLKARIAEGETEGIPSTEPAERTRRVNHEHPEVTGLYPHAGTLLAAVERLKSAGFRQIEFFSPVKLPAVERALGYQKSPVRFWTLIGALSGLVGGFALAIGTADVNRLIVGGKHPVALIPYCIVGFEGLILCGALANLAGLIVHTRRYRRKHQPYDPRYSRNTFGLVVSCKPEDLGELERIMAQTGPEVSHAIR